MAYSINLTDGTLLVTIPNNTVLPAGVVGGVLDLTLYGKGKRNYGEAWNENFVHLLENFANSTEPDFPLEGQLWWDKSTNLLKVYVGGSPAWSTLVTAGAGSGSFVDVSGDSMTGTLNMTGNNISNVGTLTVTTVSASNITVSGLVDGVDVSAHATRHESGGADQVNHDQLTGFVTNEHINHASVSISAGTGLSGGGTIAASRTLNIDIPSLSTDASPASTDYVMTYDGATHRKVTLANAVGAGYKSSSSAAIAIGYTNTWNHGLGVEPDLVKVVLQCTTAEYGYSVGDRILISAGFAGTQTTADQDNAEGITVEISTSQVVVRATRKGSDTGGQPSIYIHQHTMTGANDERRITAANWRIYIKAVAF